VNGAKATQLARIIAVISKESHDLQAVIGGLSLAAGLTGELR
jgi:hypothetical protein